MARYGPAAGAIPQGCRGIAAGGFDAVGRDLASLTERRRRLGLTVHELAHIARLRTARVCRPDGVAMLRLHWVMLRLEDGWSIQQVRQAIEYWVERDNTVFAAPASAAVAGESTPAGGGGGRRVGKE